MTGVLIGKKETDLVERTPYEDAMTGRRWPSDGEAEIRVVCHGMRRRAGPQQKVGREARSRFSIRALQKESGCVTP